METFPSIDQQVRLIKDFNQKLTNDQLRHAFDTIVIELNQSKPSPDVKIIHEIVSTISLRFNHDRIFSSANLLDHQLFLIIRDYYLNLMHRWRTGQSLDPSSTEAFSQIARLFLDLCSNATDDDAQSLKILLLNQSLIDELCHCLKEIVSHGKYLHDQRLEAVNSHVRAISYLEKGRVEIQSMKIVSDLLDQLLACVCSKYFLDMFKKIGQLKELDVAQTFLLDTCTDFISWHDAGRYNDTHIAVRTALLHEFTLFLQNNLSALMKFNKTVIRILGQLSITVIGGNARDEDIFPSPIREDYCRMIDQLSSVLNSIIESKKSDEITIMLTQILTQCLYSLTMTNDLRTYIKNKHIVPLLLKLTNFEDETIQFNVYRTLAAILTEEDVKTLANPSKIANVFLKFLTNLIDDSSRTPRFYNLLRSLKSKFSFSKNFRSINFFPSLVLIQHDQIKEEVTRQEILPLLIRCASESKFDAIKARLPALEILLALTFNTEAANQLKQNAKFLATLKTLLTNSSEQRLQRVAEGVLWKLEKEEQDILATKSNSNKKPYHVMLSYSHSDKELCYRIHDRLVKDQFKVWIDREQMHGQTMVAMANAIENSEYVFICMSEAYKQSAYCQSEAHYAFERHCLLIPLIMKTSYRPDGWLGILVSGKIYVDFTKVEFDVAYQKLINEINQHRTSTTQVEINQKQISNERTVADLVMKTDLTIQQPLMK